MIFTKNQYGELILDANGNPVVATDDAGYPIIMYTTYGVNNKNSSSPSGYTLDGTPGVGNLASSNVIGKPVFSIPYLGYVAHFVQNPPGKYITLLVCAFLVLNTIFSSTEKKSAKNADEPQDGNEDGQADDTPTPPTE